MENGLKQFKINIGNGYATPFCNANNIYQDGTIPFCRDKNGTLWAISGHSHCGAIYMLSGNDFEDIAPRYPIQTSFCVGDAEYAFDRVRYPEGIKARGSIWPFGLYICPGTNRFFCFFHNETGWNGKGTGYDAVGYCDVPKSDSDFRHIGLMHSDDEGRNWVFDRWLLSGEAPCFSTKFNPDKVNVAGQSETVIKMGAGDFSLFMPKNDDYMYIFYNIIEIDTSSWEWTACNTYVARSRKRSDGVMGDFVKYYNGSFCEAGNFGRETPVIINSWHPRVAYFKALKAFVLTSSPANFGNSEHLIADYMEMRTSADLIHWSEPITVQKNGRSFGNHYQAINSYHGKGDTYFVESNKFTVLNCHNGTDVTAFDAELAL